jgi:hypothetical protein
MAIIAPVRTARPRGPMFVQLTAQDMTLSLKRRPKPQAFIQQGIGNQQEVYIS